MLGLRVREELAAEAMSFLSLSDYSPTFICEEFLENMIW